MSMNISNLVFPHQSFELGQHLHRVSVLFGWLVRFVLLEHALFGDIVSLPNGNIHAYILTVLHAFFFIERGLIFGNNFPVSFFIHVLYRNVEPLA